MIVKIDSHGRITIPRDLREVMDLKEECYLYLSGDGQRLYLTTQERFNLDEIIRKRLKNKNISIDERNFLNKLRNNL